MEAKKNGLDITDQRGRQFKASDFEEFDHIFVMDTSNRDDVLALANSEEDRAKVQLILDEIFPGENVDVPDPYHGGDRGFDQVYEMLDKASDKLAERL
jgi:protein-tyrosine phosphatase